MNQLNRYDGSIVPYASSELAAMLTRLIAQGQTSCIGNDDIAIVRVDSVGLLLVDVAWIVGRRLFELYSPTSDSTMPFGLRWQLQNQGAYTLTQALSGSGYAGGTVTDLSLVHMMLYTGVALPYLEAGQLVAAQGFVENSPARLMSIAAGNNILMTTEGEVITISTNADTTTKQLTDALDLKQDSLSAGNPTEDHVSLLVGDTILSLTGSYGVVATSDGATRVNLSTEGLANDIWNLQADVATKQPAILALPSAPDSGKFDIFDGSSIKSLSADAPLAIANNGTSLEFTLDLTHIQKKLTPLPPITLSTTGSIGIDSTVFAPANSTYSQTQVNNLVNDKATTDYVDAGLRLKADLDKTYSRIVIDAFLSAKADVSKTYSRDATNTLLNDKADLSYVNTGLAGKADKATTYTKTEIDEALNPLTTKD